MPVQFFFFLNFLQQRHTTVFSQLQKFAFRNWSSQKPRAHSIKPDLILISLLMWYYEKDFLMQNRQWSRFPIFVSACSWNQATFEPSFRWCDQVIYPFKSLRLMHYLPKGTNMMQKITKTTQLFHINNPQVI